MSGFTFSNYRIWKGNFNISSINKTATGVITVSFTNSFSDTNYVAVVGVNDSINAIIRTETLAVGSLVVGIISTNGASTAVDAGFSLVCFGV